MIEPPSQQTKREASFVVIVWISACVYVFGYAAMFAFRREPPSLVIGMPGWVVWGVMLPWAVCTAITLWFSCCGMKDEDIQAHDSAPAEEIPQE